MKLPLNQPLARQEGQALDQPSPLTQYLTLNDLSYLQHKNKLITPTKSQINIELQRDTVEGMTEYDSEYDYGADITFYKNKENGLEEQKPLDKAIETEYK